MIPKQDRVRPRTVEDLERKYRDVFDRRTQQQQQQVKGEDGLTPYIGTNGNWFIGNVDTGVPAKGQDGAGVGIAKIEKIVSVGLVDTYKITLDDERTYTFTVTNGRDGVDGVDGEDGKDGKDGVNGTDGHTPYIQDGYWYINGTNTNVKAEGRDGSDGTPFKTDKTLALKDGVLSVNTATTTDRDLPIKAVDVDVIVGNIEVLLETI